MDLERLKELLKKDEAASIKEAFQKLEASAYRIADALYADQQQKSGS